VAEDAALMPKMILERPVEGATPAGQLALHEAGYREVLARAGGGLVLDVGCGEGEESARLLRPDRVVVGLDYDPATARHAASAVAGLRVACGDGAVLPFRDGAFDVVCSSHLIEHFVSPDRHAAELARVLREDGTVFVVTPNAPADFENPFHVSLFTASQLRSMLERFFADVSVVGLDGDAVVKADFARRRNLGAKLLKLDVFNLRKRLPQRWYVRLHGVGRRLLYPFVIRRERKHEPATADRFAITDTIDDTTLVLFAICRSPHPNV
jgi:SAM-dependent methyltransferase